LRHYQWRSSLVFTCSHSYTSARLCDTYAVQAYNAGIQQFPAALFATALNFTPREFFDVREDRKMIDQAPAVKFCAGAPRF